MPNPRYLTEQGEPTVELLQKLSLVKKIYFEGVSKFSYKYSLDKTDFGDIQNIFLIGSHANKTGWNNETSDLDLKIVNPSVLPEFLWKYKKEVLNPFLCFGREKKRWIDVFFAREDYQVTFPRWELIEYWNKDI